MPSSITLHFTANSYLLTNTTFPSLLYCPPKVITASAPETPEIPWLLLSPPARASLAVLSQTKTVSVRGTGPASESNDTGRGSAPSSGHTKNIWYKKINVVKILYSRPIFSPAAARTDVVRLNGAREIMIIITLSRPQVAGLFPHWSLCAEPSSLGSE